VTICSSGTTNHPGTPWASIGWIWTKVDCLRAVMHEEHLTIDQCDELAKALREDAARLPRGSERENLLRLAEGYRVLADKKRFLADMKRRVLRKVN
jgi:hypothetical protein